MTTATAHHSSSNSFFQFADAAFLVIISQRISGQLVESLHKTVEIVEHWCGQIFPQDKFFLEIFGRSFHRNKKFIAEYSIEETLQQNVVFATIEGHGSSHMCEESFVISCVYCDTYYAYIIL
jgi:hypothetical protein